MDVGEGEREKERERGRRRRSSLTPFFPSHPSFSLLSLSMSSTTDHSLSIVTMTTSFHQNASRSNPSPKEKESESEHVPPSPSPRALLSLHTPSKQNIEKRDAFTHLDSVLVSLNPFLPVLVRGSVRGHSSRSIAFKEEEGPACARSTWPAGFLGCWWWWGWEDEEEDSAGGE